MNLERRRRQPSIDIPGVVDRVKAGDQFAYGELDGFLRPTLNGFFARRFPIEAEDLTQDTLAEVAAALPAFDPTLGGRDYSKSFMNWTFTIARANLNMELRRVLKARTTPFDDKFHSGSSEERVNNLNPDDLMPKFRERLGELLPPTQLPAVELRMAGKELTEIRDELGLTDRAVVTRLSRARETIEGELIYPAGFRQVADYEDGALSQAASKGRLEAVKFLGLWYTKDEWVQRYHPRRVGASQVLTEGGHLLLSEQAAPDEYGTLLGYRYQHLLMRHHGRIYITAEGLTQFRTRKQRRPKTLRSPGEEYQPTRGLTGNITQESRLRAAAIRGEIDAVKAGNWWFVKPDEAEEYLGMQPPEPQVVARPIEIADSAVKRDMQVFKAEELEKLPEGEFPEAFNKWFFKTAKVVSDQRLPWYKRRKLPHPDDPDKALDIFVRQVFEWLKIRAPRTKLPQRDALELKLRGKKSREIAVELGQTEQEINTRSGYSRKVLENKLLYPAGIKRVADYREGSLNAAAISGRMEAVWFLGRWYTTDEKVSKFKEE